MEKGSSKHSVFTRASCRRRADAVMPRAEHVGDLITADHKVLSEASESRNNHRYAVVVQGLGHPLVTVLPVQNQNFSGNPHEPNEVLGAFEETMSHIH